MKPMPPPVRRALLSVSDKTGLVELARELARRNIEILSTGGTAQLLTRNGVPVREVAAYTGFPEIMDGRVKTLHPRIHGGLLGRRGVDDAVMAQHAIAPIDLLVVNLYPFAATVARPDCRYADAVGNIDIGGPARLPGAVPGSPPRACCRGKTFRTTTLRTRIPPSSACASSVRPPASSSSTPTPAGSPWRPHRWRPTRQPTAPIRLPRTAASSPSTASSTRPPRPRASSASSSKCWRHPPCTPPPRACWRASPTYRGCCSRSGRGAPAPKSSCAA